MLALNPWVILAALCTLAGICGGSYVKGRSDGKAVIIASQAKEEAIRLETLQLAQMAAAEEIAKIDIRHVTIKGKVEREVITKVQYRDCAHDDDTLRLLNDAITGRDAQSADHGELPRPDAAARF